MTGLNSDERCEEDDIMSKRSGVVINVYKTPYSQVSSYVALGHRRLEKEKANPLMVSTDGITTYSVPVDLLDSLR